MGIVSDIWMVTEKYPWYFPWYLVVVVLITQAVLKATELLVSSSRSDYISLLPNGILYATEIPKLGSSQYTNNI